MMMMMMMMMMVLVMVMVMVMMIMMMMIIIIMIMIPGHLYFQVRVAEPSSRGVSTSGARLVREGRQLNRFTHPQDAVMLLALKETTGVGHGGHLTEKTNFGDENFDPFAGLFFTFCIFCPKGLPCHSMSV